MRYLRQLVSATATGPVAIRLSLVLLLALSLAACGGSSSQKTSGSTTSAGATGTAVASSATPSQAASTPITITPSTAATPAIATPSATPLSLASSPPPIAASATPTTQPTGAVENAIKKVIQRGNQEEVQAVAQHDPALMRDTSTPGYYSQLIQELATLGNSGIKAIKLVSLRWGPIALQGPATAQAITLETWRTDYADGTSTLAPPDINVYTLVKEGGAWKVQSDDHPDTQRLRPVPGTPGVAPTAAAVPGGPGQSLNWAGYEATGGTFTAVAGSWTIPHVSVSNKPAANATWIGIGGVSSHDLIQAGTNATIQNGQLTYTAWLETLPQPAQSVPLTVSAGDQIHVTIAQQPGGLWQIVIRDTTTGKSFKASGSYGSSRSSAEWVEEAPTTGRRLLLPLDDFGKVTFTGATATKGGKQQTISQAGGNPITMVNQSDKPLAKPSTLSSDGSSFSVTRTSVASQPSIP